MRGSQVDRIAELEKEVLRLLQELDGLSARLPYAANSKIADDAADVTAFHLAGIVDHSWDAIIGTTLDGIITSWNRAAEQRYGHSREESIGQSLALIIPPDRMAQFTRAFERLRHGEMILPFVTDSIRKDGVRIPVSIQISPILTPDSGISGASMVARDNSWHEQAMESMRLLQGEAEAKAATLETANRVAHDILFSETGTEAMRAIVTAAQDLTQARYAALGVARPDGRGLMEFVTAGLTGEQEAELGMRPVGAGLLGHLLKCKEPLRLDDLSQHVESSGFPPNHPLMRSFLGVPIRRGDAVLGSLYLTDKQNAEAFTDADEAAVLALGNYAAVAIHNWLLRSRHQALLQRLIFGQEEERRAVAYDLHDGLTQYVMAAQVHLETARRFQDDGNDGKAMAEWTMGMRYLQHAVTESRRMVNGLRSLALVELGLAGALEQLVFEEKSRAGWNEVTFIHNIEGERFDFTVEATLFRVIQEALNNCRKHADTSRIRVMLLRREAEDEQSLIHHRLFLEVQDWGKGFVLQDRQQDSGGVGMYSMAERISLIGGTYSVTSVPGKGTVIRAAVTALPVDPLESE